MTKIVPKMSSGSKIASHMFPHTNGQIATLTLAKLYTSVHLILHYTI